MPDLRTQTIGTVCVAEGSKHERPGELNHVAVSNCAREPARQAGQREPHLQMLCKRLQRHNRHTCGGAAKGSKDGWYRRRCVLRHPHRTPRVPNGTGQRCVGRNVIPEPYSLGYWQNGSWARVRTWEPGGKGNCSFLRKWVPLSEMEDSPPGPPPGEGAALFSPSPEKEQIPTSPGCPHQGRFVDFLAKVSIRPGAQQLWRTQEGAHGYGQTEAWPRGQRWMVHHAGAGVLVRLGLLLYHRELLGKALDGVAEQPCLGDGGIEKMCLVDVLHLYQVELEMALLDHHGGHRLPEGPRRDFRRS